VGTASNLYIADSHQGTTMTDERSGVHLGHLDLGSGFALEMIQDEKQQFSREREHVM
jgi:hypothetical protein